MQTCVQNVCETKTYQLNYCELLNSKITNLIKTIARQLIFKLKNFINFTLLIVSFLEYQA